MQRNKYIVILELHQERYQSALNEYSKHGYKLSYTHFDVTDDKYTFFSVMIRDPSQVVITD